MTKLKGLTIDEHYRVGATLAMIQAHLDKHQIKYWKKSETNRRIERVKKDIERLRDALEKLMTEPCNAYRPVSQPTVWPEGGEHVEALMVRLDNVRNMINYNRVPARVLDKYIRCDSAMFKLRTAIVEMPKDVRR